MSLKGRIVIFSIVGCPHCLRAKNKLSELKLPYHDVSLDKFPHMRDVVKELTGGKASVPQIFFNDYYVGGNDDFQDLIKNQEEFEKVLDIVKLENPGPKAPQIPDPSSAVDFGKNEDFVCNPDEFATLMKKFKAAEIIKDNRLGWFSREKSSFKGSELVEWLTEHGDMRSQEDAVDLCHKLIDKHFFKSVCCNKLSTATFLIDDFYRLLEDNPTKALNSGPMSKCTPMPGDELSELLRKLILKLYDTHLKSNGKGVDYEGIKNDGDFEKYESLTLELRRLNMVEMTREERLAFFINIYNALVIHATIRMGAPMNLWQRYKFFNNASYVIGGFVYSLQDIENGVLRGNRKGVGMFRNPFVSEDPRLKIALNPGEPLIHFALNCGAKSCPPIKTFSAKGINGELKVAGEAFLETEDGVQVEVANKRISLTKIFKWYREDFGGSNDDIVNWIFERMAESDKKSDMKKVLASGSYNVTYMPYDWGTNSDE